MSMKVGRRGQAAPHAAYIARAGKYGRYLERGEKLEATEAGNMPAWARDNPLEFWQAADAYERANGTTYREMEIALPRELDAAQRVALVRDFVRQEIGERHAYQWAIHAPTAADGKEQPHVHLMISERQVDGIERDPEQYFKRYNARAPEKGGARKGYGPHAGKTLTRAERVADLKALRMRWEAICNAHLARAGVSARIDMRSHAERGTGLEPERKMLPSEWRSGGKAKVIEWRQARAELAEARQELARIVPDARAAILDLEARERAERERREAEERQRIEAERQRREQAQREQAQRQAEEVARLRQARLAILEAEQQAQREQQARREARERARREVVRLREQIERLRGAEEQDSAVVQAKARLQELERQYRQARGREERAQREAAQWREAHPIRAALHDNDLIRAAYLIERGQVEAQARSERQALGDSIEEADMQVVWLRREAKARARAEAEQLQVRLDVLEGMLEHEMEQVEEAQEAQHQVQWEAMEAEHEAPEDGGEPDGPGW